LGFPISQSFSRPLYSSRFLLGVPPRFLSCSSLFHDPSERIVTAGNPVNKVFFFFFFFFPLLLVSGEPVPRQPEMIWLPRSLRPRKRRPSSVRRNPAPGVYSNVEHLEKIAVRLLFSFPFCDRIRVQTSGVIRPPALDWTTVPRPETSAKTLSNCSGALGVEFLIYRLSTILPFFGGEFFVYPPPCALSAISFFGF